MKNILKETVNAILSVLKDCCPTLKNTGNLSYETDNIICTLCECNHYVERCPCARVLTK